MSVEITVRGAHEVAAPAERGTVRASVHLWRAAADEAMAAVADAARGRHLSLEAQHDPDAGPVVGWSGDQVHSWLERHDDYGERLRKPAQHARATIVATFSDHEALGRWLTESAAVEGFEVDQVTWDLTAERRAALERDARVAAVAAAVRQAQDYADALALGEVRAVSLSDDASSRDDDWEAVEPASFAARDADDGAPVPVAPREVVVRAGVRIRFLAG